MYCLPRWYLHWASKEWWREVLPAEATLSACCAEGAREWYRCVGTLQYGEHFSSLFPWSIKSTCSFEICATDVWACGQYLLSPQHMIRMLTEYRCVKLQRKMEFRTLFTAFSRWKFFISTSLVLHYELTSIQLNVSISIWFDEDVNWFHTCSITMLPRTAALLAIYLFSSCFFFLQRSDEISCCGIPTFASDGVFQGAAVDLPLWRQEGDGSLLSECFLYWIHHSLLAFSLLCGFAKADEVKGQC